MTWLFLALLTAFFVSLKDVLSKKSLENLDEYLVAWALRFFVLPFLLPVLWYTGVPEVTSSFWWALLASGTLNLIATVLYMKALKCSDLSSSLPLITFTPLFLLLTSPLILQEFPSWQDHIGILVIVLGAYILNIQKRKQGFWMPFYSLVSSKGSRLMLLVAFIWSISSNIDKIGVQGSDAFTWVIAVNAFISIALLPVLWKRSTVQVKSITKNVKGLLPIGFCSAIALSFQMTAIQMTLVAHVIAVKRMSIVFGVLFGFFLFKEKHIKERLLATCIMIVGVLIMSFS